LLGIVEGDPFSRLAGPQWSIEIAKVHSIFCFDQRRIQFDLSRIEFEGRPQNPESKWGRLTKA